MIPQELAHEHVVFPLRIDAESIYLAMASPDSEATVEELEFVTGKKVKVHVALDYVIREVIDYSYAAQEDGDEFYVGAHVTDAALAELGLSDLKRAPEPNIERQSDPGGEETEDAALAESPVTDDELFPNDETRTADVAEDDPTQTVPFTLLLANDDPGTGEGTQTLTITAVGSHVAMPGKMHRMTMATTMQATKGREPFRIVFSEMSGAMPLMT